MEIINEIKPNDDQEKKTFVHRSLAEVQRVKLEKLMKNPEKPVIIPESTKRDKEYNAPTFVRNVMGSSAGAGSGEFHVYRHLRRKEYARQKHLKMQSETERMNDEYQQRLEDNQIKAESKTSKKRAKRLRQKLKAKQKGKKPKLGETPNEASDKSDNSEDEDDDDENNENDSNEGSGDDKPAIVAPKPETDEDEAEAIVAPKPETDEDEAEAIVAPKPETDEDEAEAIVAPKPGTDEDEAETAAIYPEAPPSPSNIRPDETPTTNGNDE